ncbi:MAG: ABC transporter ATP-binding protein/permease, partial [Oscillospiraceae bacterium]|nr:ABC transporter ATP-binding protein/permease [Oscillospiraceae bacterium]
MKNIKTLTLSIKPYGGEMLLTILTAFLKHGSMLGAAALSSYMVGLAMERRLAARFPPLFALLCACILLRAAFYFGEMYFAHDVAFRVIRDFRLKLYKKVAEVSPALLLGERTGSVGETLVSDVEVIELFLAHTFSTFIVAVIITLILLPALAVISPLLAAMMLVFALVLGFVPFYLKKSAESQGRDVREKKASANAMTLEGILGLRELMTLNRVERYKAENRKSLDALYGAQLTYGKRQGTESLIAQICVGGFSIAVAGISAMLVAGGHMAFALYPVAVILAAMLFSPILELASAAQNLGLVFAATNRIQRVLHTEPMVTDAGTSAPPQSCEVEFEDVRFAYGGAPVLRGVSFV